MPRKPLKFPRVMPINSCGRKSYPFKTRMSRTFQHRREAADPFLRLSSPRLYALTRCEKPRVNEPVARCIHSLCRYPGGRHPAGSRFRYSTLKGLDYLFAMFHRLHLRLFKSLPFRELVVETWYGQDAKLRKQLLDPSRRADLGVRASPGAREAEFAARHCFTVV